MDECFCPNCNAILNDQFGFDPDLDIWKCDDCGILLMSPFISNSEEDDEEEDYSTIIWYCDNCNALLNKQYGFTDCYGVWRCTECGYINGTSEDDIINDDSEEKSEDDTIKCPNCGVSLNEQWGFSEFDDFYTCTSCWSKLHHDYPSKDYSILDEDDYRYRCPKCDDWLIDQFRFSELHYDYTCESCGSKLHRSSSFAEFSVVDDDDDDDDGYEEDIETEDIVSIHSDPKTSTAPKPETSKSFSSSKGSVASPKEYVPVAKKAPNPILTIILLLPTILIVACTVVPRLFTLIDRYSPQTVGFDSESVIGMDYKEVVDLFINSGFENIETIPNKDLSYSQREFEDKVKRVTINGKNSFKSSSKHLSEAKVQIYYHAIMDIKVPISNKEAKKLNYTELEEKFKDAGFVNVKTVPEYDLVTGWINKDGSIAAVTINNDEKFDNSSTYRPDVEVIITYHTFKKNKKE